MLIPDVVYLFTNHFVSRGLYVRLLVALNHDLGLKIRPSWVHVYLFIYNI